MIKAVVFDFDGLIIDTETAWFHAFKEALEEYGVELPLDVFLGCVGTNDTVLMDFINKKLGENYIEIIKNLAREKHKSLMKNVTIREGVIDYLITAKKLGLKIGLASSSHRKWIDMYLTKLGIYDFFQVIKTGDEVEKVKPDPALYILAIEALGVPAHEAIAFEDSANGAKAAVSAGLRCVIVPNEITKYIEFENFDLRISAMTELSLEQVVHFFENQV